MHAWIRNAWERKGIGGKALCLLLLPASYLYGLMVQIRNLFFSRGWIRTSALEKPVISIGNLTVGGTGKTPSCLWLARELNQRGVKVGILSRGYPRKKKRKKKKKGGGGEETQQKKGGWIFVKKN